MLLKPQTNKFHEKFIIKLKTVSQYFIILIPNKVLTNFDIYQDQQQKNLKTCHYLTLPVTTESVIDLGRKLTIATTFQKIKKKCTNF